jgi:hypothetical protein
LLRPSSKESEVISATGVAKGAILRACDKENGPARRPRLSYGVLRHLEYQNEEWLAKKHPALAAALKEGKKKYNHLDGKYWIEDTIEWIIKAVCQPSISPDISLTKIHRVKAPSNPSIEYISNLSIHFAPTMFGDRPKISTFLRHAQRTSIKKTTQTTKVSGHLPIHPTWLGLV